MARVHGIDVSHFQNVSAPGGVAWPSIAERSRFVIVRASYGTFRDPSAAAHVAAARKVGLDVGLYHFYRFTQPVQDQLSAFLAQAAACKLGAGDLAPALDIEDDPNVSQVSPSWDGPLRSMCNELLAAFGEVMLYITQRDWMRVGKPQWMLERPLWVAHYTAASAPATPGDRPWRIWQYRVGPYDPAGPGGPHNPQLLDQNHGEEPLPRVLQAEQLGPSRNLADVDAQAPTLDEWFLLRNRVVVQQVDLLGRDEGSSGGRDVLDEEAPDTARDPTRIV